MKQSLSAAGLALLYVAFAALWIVASDAVLGLLPQDGATLARLQSAKGLAFVVVTGVALYLILVRWRRESAQARTAGRAGESRLDVVPVFAAFLLAVPAITISAYSAFNERRRIEAIDDLKVIAALKAGQIETWIAERVGDGRSLLRSASFVAQVAQYQRTRSESAGALLLDHLTAKRDALGYEAITLVDAEGRRLLAVGDAGRADATAPERLGDARAKRDVVRLPLERDAGGRVHLDFVVPLPAAPGEGMVGFVILHTAPGRFLYPLISVWPAASRSGETLVVRRHGDRAEFLNDLRFRPDAALRLTFPLDGEKHPGVTAVLDGRPGVAEAPDYRGVPAIAAYHPVRGTDWMIVAKVDRDEVQAVSRDIAYWIGGIASIAMGIVGVAFLALLRQRHAAQRLALQAQSEQSLRRFFELPFIGMAITSPASRRWLVVNDRLCEILGRSREALIEKTWVELTHPDDLAQDEAQFARMAAGELDGYRLDKRFVRPDGAAVDTTIDVKCTRAADGAIENILCTVIDVTESKAATARALVLGRYYAALSECNEAIVRCADEATLLPAVCRAATSVAGIRMAWVGMVDERRMIVPVAWAGEGSEYLNGIQVSADPGSPLSHGPTGTAVHEGVPYWCADFQRDPRTAPWHERGGRFGWRASAALPLRRGDQVVGALTLYMGGTEDFAPEVRQLLMEMAGDISFALDVFARDAERTRAEHALRERESLISTVLDSSMDGIIIGRPDGSVQSANRAMCAMLGYSEAEIVALGRDGLADPDDPAWAQAEADRRATGRVRAELRFRRKDGSVMSTETSSVIFREPDGTERSSVVVRDITVRKRAEAELRASAERLAFYFRTSPVVGYNLKMTVAGEVTLWVSDNVEALTGYSVEEASAAGWWESHLHPEDREGALGVFGRVFDTDELTHEYRFLCKDGRAIWVRDELRVLRDVSGHPGEIVGAWLDVTERRLRDAEIRKLSLAVEQSPESIMITDADTVIEYVNEAFLRVTGYTREEVIGQTPRVLHSNRTPRETYDAMWAALSRGEPWKGQFVNRRKDGSEYVEFAIIAPIRQADGRITHYLAIKDDITEKKRLGQELDAYRQRLEELVAQRTAELAEARERADAANQAKSSFLANMSHEIRTPMNAILGLTYLMRKADPTPEQAARLDKVAASADHLLSLIDDILDLSKIEAGRMSIERTGFELGAVVRGVGDIVRERAEAKGLALEIDIAPGLPSTLLGDPLRLRQILVNLAGNAVKFTQRGHVALRVHPMQGAADPVRVRFEIVDTGIGIDREQRAHLFKPFEQADTSTTRRFGGTGLGLAICRRLVEMMDGSIGVESEPGRGSTFWFEVPFGRGAQTAPEAGREPAGMAVRRGLSILLVEDDPINQEVASELLAGGGHRVEIAADGAQAVAMAAAADYDLVLMDLQMPEMDGLAATRALRATARHARTPILALTANAFDEDRRRCLEAGMNDFIAKPVEPDRMFATIARWAGIGVPEAAKVPASSGDAVLPPVAAAIAGVDVEAGLRSVAGRADRYLDLLRRFRDEHAGDMRRLRDLLAGGMRDDATRVAHTLKGLAGTIGAQELQRRAATLERGLRDPSSIDRDIERGIGSIQDELARLIDAMRELPGAQAPVPDGAPLDRGTADAQLRQLESLLAVDDVRSLECWSRNRAAFAELLGRDAVAVGRAIEHFEFDEALAAVRRRLGGAGSAGHGG